MLKSASRCSRPTSRCRSRKSSFNRSREGRRFGRPDSLTPAQTSSSSSTTARRAMGARRADLQRRSASVRPGRLQVREDRRTPGKARVAPQSSRGAARCSSRRRSSTRRDRFTQDARQQIDCRSSTSVGRSVKIARDGVARHGSASDGHHRHRGGCNRRSPHAELEQIRPVKPIRNLFGPDAWRTRGGQRR